MIIELSSDFVQAFCVYTGQWLSLVTTIQMSQRTYQLKEMLNYECEVEQNLKIYLLC